MTIFENLDPIDRAEIDQGVRDSYVEAETGRIRPVSEAAALFLQFMASATQAHREYADLLRAEWEQRGAAAFVKDRWKAMETVHFKRHDSPATVARPGNRGVRRPDETGRPRNYQLPLLMFDADALERGIVEAVRRIDAERVTIANYRRLLDLLRQTGCTFVHEALSAVSKTLDEFLAEDEQASA